MRRCGTVVLSAACAVFLGFGSSAGAQDRFTVRDSWVASGLQAGWQWAFEKGLFAKEGLDVALEDGNGSTTTVQLVASGKFDVGHADLSVAAIARAKGMPLVAVAGLIQRTSLGVFVPKGSGIKVPKDFEGKEIIYTATSFEGPFMDAFLKAGGTSRDKVKLTSVDASAKFSTYSNGRGEGVVSSVPYGVPDTRPSDYILFEDYGLALPSYGLIVREDVLSARAAGLKKLAKAYMKAWQEIIDGGEAAAQEATDIIIKRRPDAKLVRSQVLRQIVEHIKYFRTKNTASLPLGVQSSDDWKRVVQTLEAPNLIPKGTDPNSYFTNALFDRPK